MGHGVVKSCGPGVLLSWCSAVLVFCSLGVLRSWYSAVLVYRCPAVLVFCGPAVLWSWCCAVLVLCGPAVLPENRNIGRRHPCEGEERLRERESVREREIQGLARERVREI